jgi:hypothetical protein
MGEIEMQRRLITCLFAVLGVLQGNSVFAAIGPTQSPLRVAAMYSANSGSIYVAFQSGAMPGCYGNAGGYLFANNLRFKEIHAQLLTMVASGGIRAAVVFTQNTPSNNWDDCTIDGIYLLPE